MSSFFEGILEHATECICSDSWIAKDSSQLTVRYGDHINIIERTTDDWWYGECNEKYGYVPTNYIKLRVDNYIDEFNVQIRIGMETKPDEYPEQIEKCLIDNIAKDLLQDCEYFDGYNSIQIHHEMLTDKPRTQSYKDACISLKKHIENKIVLDLGCGTGILSIFCAQNGAKHVYGVEASKFAFKTRKIVEANGLNGKISILHGKIEDIFLPVEQVDIIISEWMGTMLVTESMICSVLYARDKYLRGYQQINSQNIITTDTSSDDCNDEEKKLNDDLSDDTKDDIKHDINNGLAPPPLPKHLMDNIIANTINTGLMMPSHCNLYFAPIDLSDHIDEKINYFDDVYGVNMKPLKDDAIELYLAHATYEIEINAKSLLCNESMIIKHYDMYTCTDSDLENLEKEFEFVINKNGLFCGFSGWFDVIFNSLHKLKNDKVIILDTSPNAKRTHWSQTLFPLSEQIKVVKGDVVTGKLSFFRNNVSIRHYRLFIQCKLKGKVYRKMFFLWD
eukprot:417107_1